ncbi:hypothetical protein Hanom_Chr11g01044081 [Helianthus anomalus]
MVHHLYKQPLRLFCNTHTFRYRTHPSSRHVAVDTIILHSVVFFSHIFSTFDSYSSNYFVRSYFDFGFGFRMDLVKGISFFRGDCFRS